MVVKVVSECVEVDFRFVIDRFGKEFTQLFTSQKLKWLRFFSLSVEDLVAVRDEDVQAVDTKQKNWQGPESDDSHIHFYFLHFQIEM